MPVPLPDKTATPVLAGIYIHIPFCRKACHYCDFVFTTHLKGVEDFIEAILREIDQRCEEINDQSIKTVYFGGGTPSLIGSEAIKDILEKLKTVTDLSKVTEVTLEANPEDLSFEKLSALRTLGINRISLGIQSFSDELLTSINRAHDSKCAKEAISWAREAGFENLSLDLIFGLPGQQLEHLVQDLDTFLTMKPEHISAYSLTIEPKTFFGRALAKNQLHEHPDNVMAEFFLLVREKLQENGYTHYEISNYAKPGFESKHNSSYWENSAYFGFGPGAHSYDGKLHRRWNTSSIAGYCQKVSKGNPYFETETLSQRDLANEFLFTRLRTSAGVSFKQWAQILAPSSEQIETVHQLIAEGWIIGDDHRFKLTDKGMLHADTLSAALFYD